MTTASDLVDRDARLFVHQHGSTPCIAGLVRADGIWLQDEAGRRLIDLHGNTVHHVGHAHPRVIDAIKRQLDLLSFSPRRYTNQPATRLAGELTRRFRGGRSKLLLATGGSDAIEIAIRLARVATGRSAVLALEGSYHGHGMGAFGLSSRSLDPRLGSQLPDICHVTPYWDDPTNGADRMLADIERALQATAGGIACLVAEPLRSSCIVPPRHLWPETARLCRRHGAKLIFDEIPSGLGKTGRFFAFEHFDVVPDIVVLGKSLGGGILPIAATIADDALDVAPELALGHYTHEKNPVTAAAALATLAIIDEDALIERADRLGRHVDDCIARAVASGSSTEIRGIRGLGLLKALVLAQPNGSAEGTTASQRLVDAALRHGVSTVTKGDDAVSFSPPLTISEAEIDLAVGRLVAASQDARVS